MKYLIIATIILCQGCNEFFPSEGRFIITDVKKWDNGNYKYYIESTEGRCELFIVAEPNKYIVGDTLVLTLNPK